MTLRPEFIPAGYRLQRLLGSGNTAHVFEARHPEFGAVALKLPKSEVQREPMLRRMFENEVQITTLLKHPRVINAFEGHPTGTGAFLALELCDGALAAHLCELLPLETAYRLVLDVAQGLRRSHERQILHRDVKPANVFMQGGRAKLGDFGTGTYLSNPFSAPRASERVGTAFYMAPEIFRGEPATVQSDLYSLGILAYEVIGGVRPFTGDNEDELMLAHSSGVPVALRQQRPEVSLEVSRVVTRATTRTPDKRFDNVTAFVAAFAGATGLPDDSVAGDPRLGRSGRVKYSGEAIKVEKPNRVSWFRRRRD